jgi:hypothetical protein
MGPLETQFHIEAVSPHRNNEIQELPYAFFANSELGMILPAVENTTSCVYYAKITIGIVHINVTTDFMR